MKKYQYEELDFTETAQQCRQEQGSPKSEEHHVSKENKTPTDSQHWSWSNRTSAISQHSTESQHSAISQHSWQGNAWQGDSGQGHSWRCDYDQYTENDYVPGILRTGTWNTWSTQGGVQRGGTQSSRPTQPQLTTEPVPRPTSANQSERHSNQNTTSTDRAGAASGTIALVGTSGTDATTSGTEATTSATVEEHNYQYQESQNQWYFVSESWKELLNQKKTWIWRKDGQQQKGKKIWYEIEYEGDTPSKQKRNDGDQTERPLREVKVEVLHSQGGDCEGLRRAIQSGQASVVGNSELVWQYQGNTCWQVFDQEISREMMEAVGQRQQDQHSWTHTYSKCEGNWEGVGNLTDSFGAPPRQKAVSPKGNLIAPIPAPKPSGSEFSQPPPQIQPPPAYCPYPQT